MTAAQRDTTENPAVPTGWLLPMRVQTVYHYVATRPRRRRLQARMRFLNEATVSALCYSVVREMCLAQPREPGTDFNRVVRFVLEQQRRMPDFLRPPMLVLTLLFNVHSLLKSGRFFHRLPHSRRWSHVQDWKQSRFGFRRDLVRFYESLAVFGWFSIAVAPEK